MSGPSSQARAQAPPPAPSTSSTPPSPTPSQSQPPPFQVADQVWDNPYYPLNGPPETPEERAQLQALIVQERNAVGSAIASKRTGRSVENAARENCADLEYVYSHCLVNGGWIERATLCQDKKTAFWNCVKIQKDNMELLGYSRKALTVRERALIADEADTAYLKARKLQEEEDAKTAKATV
ncbi:hypothetical protein HKX48_004003 [Thoreauomyces humboldtii]|nr:hypothetical protein HKX48_004003 [Thoreauomyces humboldtii]